MSVWSRIRRSYGYIALSPAARRAEEQLLNAAVKAGIPVVDIEDGLFRATMLTFDYDNFANPWTGGGCYYAEYVTPSYGILKGVTVRLAENVEHPPTLCRVWAEKGSDEVTLFEGEFGELNPVSWVGHFMLEGSWTVRIAIVSGITITDPYYVGAAGFRAWVGCEAINKEVSGGE